VSRRVGLIISLLAVLFVISHPTYAGSFTAFGAQTYPRATGTPQSIAASFHVLNPNTSYTLRIQFPKGSAAEITLNGILVFSATEEFKRPATIERAVRLAASNVISVRALGKVGTAIVVSIIGRDDDRPSISATPAPALNSNGWNNTDVVVTFVCSDLTSPIVSCPDAVSVSEEGANQIISGTTVDEAGNSATASVTVNIDQTPPSASITFPPDGITLHEPEITLTGTVGDSLSGVAGVTCRGIAASVSGETFLCPLSLDSGTNAIDVQATDIAGNSVAANATVSFVHLPKVTITAPGNASYLNITPTTVTGTVDDPAATVEVNGIPAAVVNGGFSAAIPLAEGPNLITVSATAPSGVAGVASIQVTLDTTPPHVTITSPADRFVTTDSSICVSGIVNDIVVGTVNDQEAQVRVNGSAAQVSNRTFLACDVPLTLGDNVIQAVGIDRVGNDATMEITVKREAPGLGSRITLLSGNNQSSAISSQLANPLVVVLEDSAGQPIPDTQVIFKVVKNDGLLAANGQSAPSVLTTTDALGQAQVVWTLGSRAGAGANAAEAYAVGFGGTALFTATGTQGVAGKAVVDAGDGQIGVIGEALPKPLIAVVVDGGNNRLKDVPVTFSVIEGGGSFDGAPSYTVNTDSDGRAAANLTLGLLEGEANNVVEVRIPSNQGLPIAFKASGRVAGDPAQTSISGVVLDNSNVPIPGVTVRTVLTNALHANMSVLQSVPAVQTDAQGQFLISGAPVGFVKLLVDGTTAQAPGEFPSLEYDVVTVAGRSNTVGMPIYLLPLNPVNKLYVTATSGGGTLTIPEAPGFSLTFGPGQVTFPGGSKSGYVSVTVVHGDKVPMVPGFGQQPRFIVTIQPAGAIFNPPAPITLPNVDGLAPRAVTEMYSFDHDIGSFVAIGTGTVSDDGLLIRSDPGVGVLKAGWHCGGDPAANGTVADCAECKWCQNNTCVADPAQNGSACGGRNCNPCMNNICVNGECLEEELGPISCDDKRFCTTADRCQGRSCLGDPFKLTSTIANVGFDPTTLKTVFDALEQASGLLTFGCSLTPGEFKLETGNLEIRTTNKCCECRQNITQVRTVTLTGAGGTSASVTAECVLRKNIPGFGEYEGKATETLGVSLKLGGTATRDPCVEEFQPGNGCKDSECKGIHTRLSGCIDLSGGLFLSLGLSGHVVGGGLSIESKNGGSCGTKCNEGECTFDVRCQIESHLTVSVNSFGFVYEHDFVDEVLPITVFQNQPNFLCFE